jgi:hypothetical protein
MPNTYEVIASVTVGSGGAANITFSSIPQTFTDLLIKSSSRSSGAANSIILSFNGSAANFTTKGLVGTGSGSASSYTSTDALAGMTTRSTFTANTFSNNELYIPNYTSSNNKSSSLDATQENNATESYIQFNANLWSQTAAITSITLTPEISNTFAQYTTAVLYGIKNS